VRAHDDLFLRIFAKEVCGEQVRRELRLTHTWRDVDNHALFPALDHVREDLSQFLVVWADFESGIYRSGKPQHVGTGSFQAGSFLSKLQVLEEFHLLLHGHVRQSLLHGFKLNFAQCCKSVTLHLSCLP
jgi:hypothetical protein